MNHWHAATDTVFAWLARTSWQVGLLVILIVVVQLLCGRRLTPRVRYGLWLLVVVRLFVPFLAEVPAGALRWELPLAVETTAAAEMRESQPPLPPAHVPVPAPRGAEGLAARSVVTGGEPETESTDERAGGPDQPERPRPTGPIGRNELRAQLPAAGTVRPDPARAESTWWTWRGAAVAVWLLVALALARRDVRREVRFRRRLAKAQPVRDAAILELLDECRRAAGVRRRVELVSTDLVPSPALAGLRRPRLLVPPPVLAAFGRDELRHLFLHELAHVRRRDVALNVLLVVQRCTFWFHPLVHFAFSRLRASQEAARDWEALASQPSPEPLRYASTLIKLLEHRPRGEKPATAVGFLPAGHDIKRRILMITNFERPSRPVRVLGGLAFVMLAWVSFTSAAPEALTPEVLTREALTPSAPTQGDGPRLQRITVERQTEPEAWELELRAKLARPIPFRADDAGIAEVIGGLRKAADLNIVAPVAFLEWFADHKLSFQFEKVPAEQILSLACRMLDEEVSYCLARQAVCIGTRDELPRTLHTRFYNVDPFFELVPDEEHEDLLEELIELVFQFTSEGDVWEQEWVQIQAWNGLIIANQTDEVHERVEALLNRLLNRGRGEPATSEARAALIRKLGEATEVDFDRAPLSRVATLLSERHGFPIVVESGYRDDLVTLTLSDLPLSTTLQWIADVAGSGARMSMRDGAVVLGEYSDIQLAMYEVGDILAPRPGSGDGNNADGLEALIRETIDVDSWDENPYTLIVFWRGLMIVNQSAHVHAEIERLLAATRRAMK